MAAGAEPTSEQRQLWDSSISCFSSGVRVFEAIHDRSVKHRLVCYSCTPSFFPFTMSFLHSNLAFLSVSPIPFVSLSFDHLGSSSPFPSLPFPSPFFSSLLHIRFFFYFPPSSCWFAISVFLSSMSPAPPPPRLFSLLARVSLPSHNLSNLWSLLSCIRPLLRGLMRSTDKYSF